MLLLADNAAFDIVFYVAMIGVAALLLGLVWLWLRKRFQDDAGDPSLGAGFTLQELTRLHEQGDLTDEQYERARSRVTQAGSRFTEQRVDASRTRPATPGEQTGSTPKPDPDSKADSQPDSDPGDRPSDNDSNSPCT